MSVYVTVEPIGPGTSAAVLRITGNGDATMVYEYPAALSYLIKQLSLARDELARLRGSEP